MTVSRRPADRFIQLDALRFFFALIVVLGHTLSFPRTFIHGGYAVDFFFVLSGFVLSHTLIQRPASLWNFTEARFARLYPLHLATLAWLMLQLFGQGIAYLPPNFATSVALNLSLLQGTGLLGVHTLNFPGWSISVEWLVNLVLLYPIVRARSILGALLIAGVSLATLVLAWGPVFDDATVQPLWKSVPVLSGGLLRGSGEILLGYLLYEAYLWLRPRIDPARHRSLATGLEIGCGCLLVFCLWSGRHGWDVLPVPLSAALILQMATCPGRVSAFLQGRAFAALGNISYSIYLLHIPLFSMFIGADLLPAAVGELTPMWFIYFALLLLLAVASFRYLERPAQRRLMRLFRDWSTRTAIP